MRAFYLDEDEIELIKDWRRLTENLRQVLAGAIHRTAKDNEQPLQPVADQVSLRVIQG